MAAKKENHLAWGVTLLVFGILFLVKQLQLVPHEAADIIFDFKNYPLLMGVIFLLFHTNRTIGTVLVAVGLLFRLSDIIMLTRHVSDYIWPLLLITAGGIIVFRKK
ncbi:MAG TPA: hypothetical protein VK152_04350 [Paludibacter sp.]|nr:hypothetical protein [Paludibacter sp.]